MATTTKRATPAWAAHREANKHRRKVKPRPPRYFVLNEATGKVTGVQKRPKAGPGIRVFPNDRGHSVRASRQLERELNRMAAPVRTAATWRRSFKHPSRRLVDWQAARAAARVTRTLEKRTRATVGQRLRRWAWRHTKAWAANRGADLKDIAVYVAELPGAVVAERREAAARAAEREALLQTVSAERAQREAEQVELEARSAAQVAANRVADNAPWGEQAPPTHGPTTEASAPAERKPRRLEADTRVLLAQVRQASVTTASGTQTTRRAHTRRINPTPRRPR